MRKHIDHIRSAARDNVVIRRLGYCGFNQAMCWSLRSILFFFRRISMSAPYLREQLWPKLESMKWSGWRRCPRIPLRLYYVGVLLPLPQLVLCISRLCEIASISRLCSRSWGFSFTNMATPISDPLVLGNFCFSNRVEIFQNRSAEFSNRSKLRRCGFPSLYSICRTLFLVLIYFIMD